MKNKYDVMLNHSKGLYGELLIFYVKSIFYKRKLRKGKFKGLEAEEELSKLYNGVFPYIKKMAHLGYENYKDFEEIDYDDRIEYLQMNNAASSMFLVNYYGNINNYVRLLLFFAIHDTDSVEFDLTSRNIILKLMNDGEVDDYVIDFYDGFSADSKRIFLKVISSNFNFRKLTSDEVELLNVYHDKYMKENIEPMVNEHSFSKERILGEAMALVNRR